MLIFGLCFILHFLKLSSGINWFLGTNHSKFNLCIFNRFYRIVYNESEVNPPEKVLELAFERLGEKKYNPLTDNCEHFCTKCKIGRSVSFQVTLQRYFGCELGYKNW